MKYPPILVIIISLAGCIGHNKSNPPQHENSYYSKELYASNSPNGKIKLTLSEYGYDSTGCVTQVLIDFGGSVAGVYATNGRGLGIKTYWRDDSTIVVETKKEYVASQKWPLVQSFKNIVKVVYIEK